MAVLCDLTVAGRKLSMPLRELLENLFVPQKLAINVVAGI